LTDSKQNIKIPGRSLL